jgi:hypothetical protein
LDLLKGYLGAGLDEGMKRFGRGVQKRGAYTWVCVGFEPAMAWIEQPWVALLACLRFLSSTYYPPPC